MSIISSVLSFTIYFAAPEDREVGIAPDSAAAAESNMREQEPPGSDDDEALSGRARNSGTGTECTLAGLTIAAKKRLMALDSDDDERTGAVASVCFGFPGYLMTI